jgi:polyisoprenoid-binding protein YceI
MNANAATHTASTWDIDLAHSSVGFTVRHLVISKVHGRFRRWSGLLTLDPAHPADSSIEVRIETASIDTDEPKRDAHLRSADFFDAEKNPVISFRSTRVQATGEGRYEATGDLTIGGVTRSVKLDVEALGQTKDPWGGERAGYSARTSIDRRDFGLTWNQALETGGVVVGEKVEIEIEVEAVRRAEDSAAVA